MTYAARRLFRRVQKASVLGDPKTVLAAAIHRSARPEPVAPPPQAPASPVAGPGRYPVLGPSVADAQAFLQAHWDDVRRTIEGFYERAGNVWDQRGNPPQVEFAERMGEISERRVVGVSGNTFDLEIRYRWQGGGVTDTAAAVMRIAVAPDGLAVEKMWR